MNNTTSRSDDVRGLGRTLQGGTVFYLVHSTAVVSLCVSIVASTAVLVYFTRKSEGLSFHRRKISERLVVYLAVCDLLYSLDHVVDHMYQIIHLRMPPDALCITTGFFLQEFANAQSLIVAFTAVNAWILVVKERRVSLGRWDWRLLVFAFGVPTVFGTICGGLGYLGPSEAWCMADMRKREGQIVNIVVTLMMIAVFAVDILAYTLVWVKIRQTARLMKGIGGVNSNSNNNSSNNSKNNSKSSSRVYGKASGCSTEKRVDSTNEASNDEHGGEECSASWTAKQRATLQLQVHGCSDGTAAPCNYGTCRLNGGSGVTALPPASALSSNMCSIAGQLNTVSSDSSCNNDDLSIAHSAGGRHNKTHNSATASNDFLPIDGNLNNNANPSPECKRAASGITGTGNGSYNTNPSSDRRSLSDAQCVQLASDKADTADRAPESAGNRSALVCDDVTTQHEVIGASSPQIIDMAGNHNLAVSRLDTADKNGSVDSGVDTDDVRPDSDVTNVGPDSTATDDSMRECNPDEVKGLGADNEAFDEEISRSDLSNELGNTPIAADKHIEEAEDEQKKSLVKIVVNDTLDHSMVSVAEAAERVQSQPSDVKNVEIMITDETEASMSISRTDSNHSSFKDGSKTDNESAKCESKTTKHEVASTESESTKYRNESRKSPKEHECTSDKNGHVNVAFTPDPGSSPKKNMHANLLLPPESGKAPASPGRRISAQINVVRRLQAWKERRQSQGGNEKSKYARAAKTMSLFVLAYISQWAAFMIYSIWSLIQQPHYSVMLVSVFFCNAGGVMNCLVYTVMRREQNQTQKQGNSLKRLTASTVSNMSTMVTNK